jgi:hypothetical protein
MGQLAINDTLPENYQFLKEPLVMAVAFPMFKSRKKA